MDIISASSFSEWAQMLTEHDLFEDSIWAAILYAVAAWFFITIWRFKRYKASDFDDINVLKNRFILNGFIGAIIAIVITLALDICGAVTHDNHALSLFLFPLLGIVGSYIIDLKFNTGKLIEKFDEQRSVAASNSFRNDDTLRERFLNQSIKDSEFTTLTKEDTTSPRYKEKLRLIIDELQLKTKQQDEQLNKIQESTKSIENDMSSIKAALLAEQALKLTDNIYICLGMGYTTAEMDRTIKSQYYGYHQLGGNGQIADLISRYNELRFKKE